jgi:hypothetical protein
MIKEAAGLAGGVLLFPPLGMPVMLHGIAGIVVGGAGLFVADAVLKQVGTMVSNPVSEADHREEDPQSQQ